MENYEQKYKEALEIARKINSGEGVAAPKGWSMLEVIFPELKESKDERIRKEIIHLIEKSNEYGGYALHKDEADRMISWLEKQGEQKQVSITDEWIEDYWQHKKVNNPNSYDKEDEIQFDYDGFIRFCKKYCQKPTWSCEDENIFACLWGILNWVERSNYSSAENMRKYIKWLQSLKQRLNGYE